MTTIIYTGTSLSHADARAILDADYRSPVKRDDIKRVIREAPDIIGIIDGVFFDRAAVAHREIIEALNAGITVVGGSSMGALRASELKDYGMIGVGQIYEWYRGGIIESDDEVAVTFDGETLKPLSIPLVNVRATLKAARENGLIDPDIEDVIIKTAKTIFYPDRNYSYILDRCVEEGTLGAEEKIMLMDFIGKNEVDVKRDDAVEVLKKIKEIKQPRTVYTISPASRQY